MMGVEKRIASSSARPDTGRAAIPLRLVGIGHERPDAVAQRVARGVAAGEAEDEEEYLQFVGGQLKWAAVVVFDDGVTQRAPNIIDRIPTFAGG